MSVFWGMQNTSGVSPEMLVWSYLVSGPQVLQWHCKVMPSADSGLSCGFFFIITMMKYNSDQKVSVHLMITVQKVTSNVQSVPCQSPDIY
jgi:hypothetical protein